jgi:membrane protein involved in colicin uptake
MASVHQYGDHRAGSSKGKVHEVFDKSGKDAAIKKALLLDIQESTARTWCSSWGSSKPAKKKVKVAAPAKKTAKKAAKAKTPAKKKAPAKREKLEGSSASA